MVYEKQKEKPEVKKSKKGGEEKEEEVETIGPTQEEFDQLY